MLHEAYFLLAISTLCSSSFGNSYPSYFVPSQVIYLRPETSSRVGNQRPPHPEPDAVLINVNTPAGPGSAGRPGPGVFGHPGGFNPQGGPGIFNPQGGPGFFNPQGGPGVFNPQGGPGVFGPPNGPGVYGHPNPRGVPGYPHFGVFGHPQVQPEVFRHMQPQPGSTFVPMIGVDASRGGWGLNAFGPQRPDFPGNNQFIPNSGRRNPGRVYPETEIQEDSGREMHDDPIAEMFPLIDMVN